MDFRFDYHKSLEHLHVGCEKPHAYFIPYATDADALRDNRAASDRFVSLCGDWDFHFYATPEQLPDFLSPEFSREGMDKLTVPRSWQTVLGRGYDVPNYTNVNYPFPVDPPHVPDNNPCGLYVRDFQIDAGTLANQSVYLTFWPLIQTILFSIFTSRKPMKRQMCSLPQVISKRYSVGVSSLHSSG